VSAKLRLGVIGAGSWAVASHLPNLAQRRDEVEFVAVARQGKELLEKIRNDWGFALASEDYRDVVGAGIDICVVSSPTVHHYEHARAALAAGAHVLIEKPMTIEPEEAWELVRLADANGLHLVCAFGWHFRPLFRRAKRAVEECPIGGIEEMSVRMHSFTRELLSNSGAYPKASADALPEQRTWTDASVSGGGYAQAQLSHALAAALWLTGLRGQEVFAFTAAPLNAPVELHDAIVVRYEGGPIGTVTGASSHSTIGVPENELDIRAIGAEGQLSLDVASGTFSVARDDTRVDIDLGPEGGFYNCDGPPHALVDLALGRPNPNLAPGELGARTVEILHAVYASAATNAPAAVTHSAPQGVTASSEPGQ
jgi:predicted dehydrogenase